jgi:hypothetical protein
MTRFDDALAAYAGAPGGFQGALEQTFAFWAVDSEDPAKFAEWRTLYTAVCAAGESAMAQFPELFAGLADVLAFQLAQLPDEFIDEGGPLRVELERFVEDMQDTKLDVLQPHAAMLAMLLG